MPRLHLPRTSYYLFVCDFPYNFSGIVGGLKLDVCVYIVYDHHGISFGDRPGQKLTETMGRSYQTTQSLTHCVIFMTFAQISHYVLVEVGRSPGLL